MAQDAPPPLGVPVAAPGFGVVVFEAVDDGPALDTGATGALGLPSDGRARVFGWWHRPDWRDLADAASSETDTEEGRGWRLPSAADLDACRRALRQAERAARTRAQRRDTAFATATASDTEARH